MCLRCAIGDKNGRSDERRTLLSGLGQVHGIPIHGNRLYLDSPAKIGVAELQQNGSTGGSHAC